ncbi:MAG TPA: S-methyl-5-thioribose-1-phosphate isomerase [bacterium]|nr:S-methyl-5-thioribose-1-phosphate isomerase [bacterium]
MQAMRWEDNALILLDQTRLPVRKSYRRCSDHKMVAAAIRELAVRGAPAIGVAAAYGMALGSLEYKGTDPTQLRDHLSAVKKTLAATRPTAVNLFWALKRIQAKLDQLEGKSVVEIQTALIQEAQLMEEEDIETNRALGEQGNSIIPFGARVLTHCNTGALATCGYGTALGVVRAAHEAGKEVQVFVSETRPLLQGARLTAFELMEAGIPATLITDSMAGWVLHQGLVDLVIFGADRIAANGDTANKIGSYSLAVLARENGVPVFVAAPLSSFDLNLKNGADIPVEERGAKELTQIGPVQIAPPGIKVFNPAFDITPSRYLDGIITEVGILRPPLELSINKALVNKL